TRQIWISADWPQVAPGDYNGKIILSWGNFDDAIDLILSVAPVRLPDRLDCSLGMWDYVADINQPRYGVSPRNRPDAIRDMVEHKVNVVWGEWASIPQIKARSGVGKQMWDVDEEGNLVAEIDYTGWDAFVRMWPDADHYLLSHSFRVDQPFCGQEQGSEAFNRAVSQFAAMWAEHNRQIGLRPGQAGMLFFDEPSDQATYRTTYLFARAFKAGTDEILVFTDPGIGTDMKNKGGASLDDVAYARQALEMCDILCPNLSNTYLRLGEDSRASFRRRQEEGKLFWFYQCHGPTRLGDPSYFRLQAWHALRHGATGVNFWSYSSLGAMNGWKEYPGYGGRTDAPPYFGPETVTTSKHWEAVLESRQDYQYVKILRDRVGELSQAGVESPDLVEARRLAEDLAADVLEEVDRRFGRWYWSERTGNPSAIAEEGRLRVLEMLARLSDGGG
ncbi:MAG: hypothetical protein QGI83_14040, partial [Candidatus Latescibacteria bacterium]|nr:hypothetical protein [Candidatus Latescibacterota bacterium]